MQTATPQKLRLMLIEAAIKNIHRTKKAWEEERYEAGFESLSLAQDIVAELLSSLDKESNPELSGKIVSIYVFIFRCLSEGGMRHDQQKMDDALRVLNSERETWRQVCDKFGASSSNNANSARLDLSTDSSSSGVSSSGVLPAPSAKSSGVTQPSGTTQPSGVTKPSGITTATFGRPKNSPPPSAGTSSGVSWEG